MSDHGDTISRYNFHHCWACGLVARAGLDKCRRCGCPTSVDSNEGAVDWAYSHWRTLKANRIFAILRPLVTREARRLYTVEIQRQQGRMMREAERGARTEIAKNVLDELPKDATDEHIRPAQSNAKRWKSKRWEMELDRVVAPGFQSR